MKNHKQFLTEETFSGGVFNVHIHEFLNIKYFFINSMIYIKRFLTRKEHVC